MRNAIAEVIDTGLVDAKDAVCLAQTMKLGGNLEINGNTAAQGVATLYASQPVGISSDGDLSDAQITIEGADSAGNTLLEVLNGPNNGVVFTQNYFKTITTVNINKPSVTSLCVGALASQGAGVIIPLDNAGGLFDCKYVVLATKGDNLSCAIDGFIDQGGGIPGWVTLQSNIHADFIMESYTSVSAVRCRVTNYQAGSVSFAAVQYGIS